MVKFILFFFLFKIILNAAAFEHPLKNANFSEGLSGWYTETKNQLEVVDGTAGTKAIKMEEKH